MEYAWCTYEEGSEMAVSGGVTTAYQVWVQADALQVVYAPRLRTECATVDDALLRLERGSG